MSLLPSPIPPHRVALGNPAMPALLNSMSSVSRMQLQFNPAVRRRQHGWFSMIMLARVYAMYSNTPWVNPINPGPNITYPALASENECCQVERQHLKAQENFHQMMVIKTTLRTSSMPPSSQHTGPASRTPSLASCTFTS